MILSKASRNCLDRMVLQNGGSIEIKGNRREGCALVRRGLAKQRKDVFVVTAKGCKFIEKNPHV